MGIAGSGGRQKCSICGRSFARAEHLLRHERSHQNAKPFKCSYCDSTFSRKDVIKRHHFRYHPLIPQVSITSNLTPGSTAPLRNISPRRTSTEARTTEPVPESDMMPMDTETTSFQDDLAALSEANLSLLDMDPAFFTNMDYQAIGNDFLFTDVPESPLEPLNAHMPVQAHVSIASPPSSVSTSEKPSGPFWRGSTEVSKEKREQLLKDINEAEVSFSGLEFMDHQSSGNPNSSIIPSRLALERLLADFFEILPVYLPFIHRPTWKAETAHPCLIKAMAALGAASSGESRTAQGLYRSARSSLARHLHLNGPWVTEQPLWVVQSALILMSYGITSGKANICADALSLALMLSHTACSLRLPNFEYPDDSSDLPYAWERWIEYETIVRTKSSVFCFLNNLHICFNIPPQISTEEMSDSILPGNEAEWTCTTPRAWWDVRKQHPYLPVRFSEALKKILSPLPYPGGVSLGIFAMYVLLHAIVQRIWRFEETAADSLTTSHHMSGSMIALRRSHLYWEEHTEFFIAATNGHGNISSNAASMLRLAHMRLHGDSYKVRSAILSHDVQRIADSIQGLTIPKNHPDWTIRNALDVINALQTCIKLGLAQKPVRHRISVQLHLLSFEFCLFSSAWMRNLESRREEEWSPGEVEGVRLVKETLQEVELDSSNSQKPFSTKLIYAWVLIWNHSAVWGIQSLLAAAAKRFADSLPS